MGPIIFTWILMAMAYLNALSMFVPEIIISKRTQCAHFAMFIYALTSIAIRRTFLG